MSRNRAEYLLLDTHVWIWLMNADKRLDQKKYLKLIEQYSSADAVRISAISVWELGMLVAKGRLTLSRGIYQWVQESLNGRGISLEQLSVDILLESTLLGDGRHGDPADRMILSTAKNINAMIMTADDKMIAYCQRQHLNVVPVD